MGTLRAVLTLASSNILSTALNINVQSTVDADSGNVIRGKILGTAAGSSAVTIYKASDKVGNAYVFIKNMDPERENYIYVYADTSSDDPVIMKIAGGEFAFFPAKSDQVLKAYGTKIDTVVEYGVFGQDSSAVTLA
jgi:predicted ThiF/HesA family dinucleotide-utilizing enzyme